jgi:FixJ family two-component response regulator
LERQLQYQYAEITARANAIFGGVTMAEITPLVFIVDDDVSVRESLELLVRCAGLQPKTFASAQAFLNFPRANVPSCLVLDIALPGLNGLGLQQHLAVTRNEMPIIFVTGCSDVSVTVQAMKAGAQEFLTKPFDDEVLLNAIRHAIERSQAAVGRDAQVQAIRARYESLTTRERQVMGLVVFGLLNKQVGSQLGISEITVKAHRGKVMLKMEAESLPDLVRMATRLRIAPGTVIRPHNNSSAPPKQRVTPELLGLPSGSYLQ